MSAFRASFAVLILGLVACSQGRTPEQAYEALRTAVLADDYEAVVRLLPERHRTRRLADLEDQIAVWRNDPAALTEVAAEVGMTGEEILGQPRLWVLSRFVRAEMIGSGLGRTFQASQIVGVDYHRDDRADVRAGEGEHVVPHPFVREGGQWCWDWKGPQRLDRR